MTLTIMIISPCRLDIDDDEDPYPSLQHVRTSASGLLRFPDDGEMMMMMMIMVMMMMIMIMIIDHHHDAVRYCSSISEHNARNPTIDLLDEI